MHISGSGWTAMINPSVVAGLGIRVPWTEEELERLSVRQLIGLCRDSENWHKDLFRPPAPPSRVFPDQSRTRFEQIVFFSEKMFLFVPRSGCGLTRTVSIDPDGTLVGIGKLPRRERAYIYRATWLGFAAQVLLGPEEVEDWRGPTNVGSIRYWVAGHWRQLPDGWTAHKVKPNGEDRRDLGITWVHQYHKHWDDDEPCRCCLESARSNARPGG